MLNHKKNNTTVVFTVGAFIGLIIFIAIYGLDIVNVTNDSLIINGYLEKDIAQHYAGWMLFRNSPWQFPLGVGQNISYPFGSAVSYTDSIPLFAIFFKVFRNFLPETFQYFGIFVMLCFMLQGAFGGLLTNLFNKNIIVNALASAVFVLSPIMIERAFRHCALTAHFLILSALYYYFKNKGRTDFKATIPFFIINALAITIHPYFLPFTFGIMFAFCVENFVLHKKYITSPAYVLLSIVFTLFVGYSIGAFYISGSMSSIGYGMFSMNLNALHNPVSKGFENWSAILEIKPNVSYQIEGFNYLGLGIIAFIPVVCILYLIIYKKEFFSTALSFAINNFGIIFSTLALLVFAVGDWITFGGLQIVRLPIPQQLIDGIFGIFRANGRFGWLLVYSIVIFTTFILGKIKNRNISALLLCVLLFVQVFDMRGVLSSKNAYFTSSEGDLQKQVYNEILKNSFWDDAAEKYEVGHMISSYIGNSSIEIAIKFGKNNHAVNTCFEARQNTDIIDEINNNIINSIMNGTLEDNMFVIIRDVGENIVSAAKEHNYSIYSVENMYAICSNKFTDEEITIYKNEGNFQVVC